MEYERHDEEYPPKPEPLPVGLPVQARWSDRFAFEIALQIEGSGETVAEVIRRNGHTEDQFLVFARDKTFKRKVKDYRDEIVEKGLTFRMKARVQAEQLLTTSWDMIHSPDLPPVVRADLIKSTIKWADLEPRKDTEPQQGGAGGVNIVINLGEDTPKKVIDVEADT